MSEPQGTTNSRQPRRATRLSAERKRIFLRELTAHGIVLQAARAASPRSTHPKGARTTFYELRREDPEFARAWDAAVENANAALEAEIHRRGVAGYEEQRVDHAGRTTIVHRYSDACLLAMARARLPGYARTDVAVTGALKHEHTDEGSRAIADAVRALAEQMAADALPGAVAVLEADL